MIEEDDELVRIICGQFIRDLISGGGLSLPKLFPEGYKAEIYDDFPPSTQGNHGWMVQFDEYVDKALQLADNVIMYVAHTPFSTRSNMS